MSTTNQIADALEKDGIPFVRVEGVADGIEYWGLTVFHENVHAEVRECSDWVEMKAWNYTPEQFMDMLVGAGTCHMRLVYEEEDADGCIWPDHYECDACGAKVNGIMPFYDTEIPPRFCPNCRREVVSE